MLICFVNLVGGLYHFSGPGDLVGKNMVVDNSTGKYVMVSSLGTCTGS